MLIKTSELEGAALDWAVAKASGEDEFIFTDAGGVMRHGALCRQWAPSELWSQGGPLIAERITCLVETRDACYADTWADAGCYGKDLDSFDGQGPTLLIAAMRAIVAAELGDTADVPEELC